MFQDRGRKGTTWSEQDRTYCLTVLHNETQGSKTTFTDANCNNVHVEDRLLPRLKKHIRKHCTKKDEIVLNVYINNAPCKRCAPNVISFIEECNDEFECNVKITIKAVGPYTENDKELTELQQSGIALKSFEGVWEEFYNLLKESEAPGDLTVDWKPTQSMIDRDKDTTNKFELLKPRLKPPKRQSTIPETFPVKKSRKSFSK